MKNLKPMTGHAPHLLGSLLVAFAIGCGPPIDDEKPCPEPQVLVDGLCETPSTSCPPGEELVDGKCEDKPVECEPGQELVDGKCEETPVECEPGQELVDGECEETPVECEPGQELVDGKCEDKPVECEPGQELVNGLCQTKTCPAGEELIGDDCKPITCLTGQELVDGECREKTCPPGQELVGNDCEPKTCPQGQELVGNECKPITCPPGQELVGGQCVTPAGCQEGGEGTSDNPTIICDRAGLERIGDTPAAFYRLGANIDLGGSPWTPLTELLGTLDGDGFEIRNLTIVTPTGGSTAFETLGLFKSLRTNSKVLGLRFSDASVVVDGGKNVGVLAGFSESQRVEDVSLRNSKVQGHENIGGLIGQINNGKLKDVKVEETEVLGRQAIGSVVGWAVASEIDDVVVSGSAGSVRATGVFAGGVVGAMEGASLTNTTCHLRSAKVSDIRVSSEATGGNGAGGAVGRAVTRSRIEKVKINDVDAISNGRSVGGVVGVIKDDTTVKDVEVSGGNVEGHGEVGGVVGYAKTGELREAKVEGVSVYGKEAHVGGVVGQAVDMTIEDVRVLDKATMRAESARVGGVVGTLEGGALHKATVDDVKVDTGGWRAGGIVGIAFWGAVLTELDVHLVTVEARGTSVGGVAGEVEGKNTRIERVSVTGSDDVEERASTITAGGKVGDVGGVVGLLEKDAVLRDAAVYNVRVVVESTHANWTDDVSVGGVVGHAVDAVVERALTHEVHVRLDGKGRYAGGIVGEAYKSQVYDVASHGLVRGQDTVGGLFGSVWSSQVERGYSLSRLVQANGSDQPKTGDWNKLGAAVGQKGGTNSVTAHLHYFKDAVKVGDDNASEQTQAAFGVEATFVGFDFKGANPVWYIDHDAKPFRRPLLSFINE